VTSIRREFPRSACSARRILAFLSICLLSVFLLTGLVGCSTPVPTPTNTPTLSPESPTAPAETPTTPTEGTPQPTREPLIPLDDDPILGSPDAPVTIIEYSEYLCPYCRSFALETLPLIAKEYVDTGKASFTFRDFPVHGQPAVVMAMVAECAADQGKFWEMQAFVWERYETWSQSEDLLATVQGYSDELGMDTDAYTSCLQEGTVVDRIIEDYNIGVQDGVTGTPAFFINGTLARGAMPFEEFQRIIEEQLAASG
jgi:protein-disulfide isomerase